MLRLHLNIVFQGKVFNDLITCQTCLCEMSCRAISSLSLTICDAKNKAPIPINYAGIEKITGIHLGLLFSRWNSYFFHRNTQNQYHSFIFFYCLFASRYLIIYFSNMSYISLLCVLGLFWVFFSEFLEFFTQVYHYNKICNVMFHIKPLKLEHTSSS